jgi:DNA-binding MarR family transcriptional regulator
MPKAQNIVLTQSQAACLFALRQGNETQSGIALEAKLTLPTTAAALRTLARLRLAEQDPSRRWHATGRGKVCRFETVPNRPRQNTGLGPAQRRVLELLDRPMRGREIVEKLGMTPQGVRQLLIKLHAQGHVRFADPENPFWFVSRANDKTSLLSRDEERVLSVIPREYATDATKIRLASGASEACALGRVISMVAKPIAAESLASESIRRTSGALQFSYFPNCPKLPAGRADLVLESSGEPSCHPRYKMLQIIIE